MGEGGFVFGGGSFAGGSFVSQGFPIGTDLLEAAARGGLDLNSIILGSLPTAAQLDPAAIRAVQLETVRQALAAEGRLSDEQRAVAILSASANAGLTPEQAIAAAQALPAATQRGVAMGFLDDAGGFLSGAIGALGSIAQGAVSIGGQVVQAAAANPAAVIQTVQLIQALRNQSSGTRTVTLPPAMMMGGTMINSDTGSLVVSFGPGIDVNLGDENALSSFVQAIPQVLGRVLGSGTVQGAAAGAAGALGADALLSLFGGSQTLMELGPPPVNPMTGRRKSAITFIDPRTGRPVVYKSQGTALLTTGDISATRRVARVARRAARGKRRSPARQPVLALAPRNHVVCGTCLTSPCGCK